MACPSIYKPGLFTGRVAIVTGGGSGIGFAIADELLELGARVVIAGRNEEKLAAAVATLIAAAPDSRRGQLLSFRCNIRSEEDVRALMAFVLENFHRIDHLVNNAGGQFPCAAGLMKTKGWRAVIDTNLNGTFLMSREVFTQWMATHPGGSIVNITADFHKGFPGMAHTGAARAAVDNLTKTLAVEWAANGVRVNSVAPGLVHSASASANYATQFKANALASMWPLAPAKRIGTVEEISAAVLFLLSPAAAFISGATLRVDGAASLYRSNAPHIANHENMPHWGRTAPPKPSETELEESPALLLQIIAATTPDAMRSKL